METVSLITGFMAGRTATVKSRVFETCSCPAFAPPKEGRCARCNGAPADHLRPGSLPYDPHAFVPPKEVPKP